ncbi:MAG: YlxR family protein [Lachnospiraceae bacterium]|nr:YlxR family protein [Lachnospiraceae bacterium]
MAKKIPMRQCVGCGEMKNKKDMMRVLKTSEGSIVLDMTGRKNGRGAYLCMNRECLAKAGKNKGLERSFKMSIPREIYEDLEKEFEEGEDAEQTE